MLMTIPAEFWADSYVWRVAGVIFGLLVALRLGWDVSPRYIGGVWEYKRRGVFVFGLIVGTFSVEGLRLLGACLFQ